MGRTEFLRSLHLYASRRAEKDLALGISPADAEIPSHSHFLRLHKMLDEFETSIRTMVEQVISNANTVLGPEGFGLEPVGKLRLLQGDISGFGFRMSARAGIEPNGLLTFRLTDAGMVRLEAEGLRLQIEFRGRCSDSLDVDLHELGTDVIEALVLSFVKATLDGPQHAFAED